MEYQELADLITFTIKQQVTAASATTGYRQPLVGFASASDERFRDLRRVAEPSHMMPTDLLPGALSVVSFFLPFAPSVVKANASDRDRVAPEWAVAYVETNALIERITADLVKSLAEQGVRAVAEPATHNFDPVTLVSRWSHKSVAVICGLGDFGLHHMVITDAGCAGRFGSLVIDADLPASMAAPRERCLYFHDGSCLECVLRCPVGALDAHAPIDKNLCHRHLRAVAAQYEHMGLADVCGKCAIGPCSLESAVASSE